MPSRIVGIDIGSTALRAVEVANPDRANPTVLRYFEVPLPVGAVNHGEVTDQAAVTACLKQLWSEGGFKTKAVVLGLGNQRVLVRDLTVPKASLKVIRESLPFQVQDLLPVPVADAQLDFYPTSEETGPDGPTASGLLVAARKEALLGNVEAVRRAGLLTTDVDLIPFALSRVLLRRGEGEGGTAVIDVGASTASVTIAKDGVPQFVRLIPTGGLDLTVALAARLAISVDDAEKLKRNVGLRSLRDVPEHQHEALRVIHELSIELLDSLRNTVTYFLKMRPDESIGRIILTGGGAELPGFAGALAEMTRLDVVMADPFADLGLSRELKAKGLGLGPASMAVALGLAIAERATGAADTAGDRKSAKAPDAVGKAAGKRGLKKAPKAEKAGNSTEAPATAAAEAKPAEQPSKKTATVPRLKGRALPPISLKRKDQPLVVGGERRVDLLPTELRQLVMAKKVRERLVLAVAALLAVVVLGSGAANVAAIQSRSDLAVEQAQTGALLAEQVKYLDVRKVQADVARIKAALRTGASTEIDWKNYLDAVQKTLPGNVTIETVKIDSASPVATYVQSTAPLQGARVATLSFSARSPTLPSVPTWLDNLQTLPGFADALPDTVVKNDDGSYTANITMHINDGAFSRRFPAEGQ
ncbi:type IV pilus assembly protein PilM [Pseudarthrobacter sp. H2]|uniref:type IV pilus assembly protein PilM n=1 Tax=Pseudarthrobacter sp. H2 TaxID=3418415 RepID=UPI003CF77103